MRHPFFLFLLALIISQGIFAQDFNYVHYDTKDGLAGSTVYDMCQDKDGFMWFATENGLSRYDGTHFRNFTVKDGLPDNEVLKIFADSRGRVWIGTFSKELCYYFKGKVYNKEHSALISKIKLQSALLTIVEDNIGNIMLGDFKELTKVGTNNTVENLTNTPEFISHHFTQLNALSHQHEGGFLIIAKDSIFKYRNNKLSFYFLEPEADSDKRFGTRLKTDGSTLHLETPDPVIRITQDKHTTFYASTVNGSWSIDSNLNSLGTHFLFGKKVSHTINDTEGNLWFSTMGEGVYKLPSAETRTISFSKAGTTDNTEVFSLACFKDKIIAGLGFSKAAAVEGDTIINVLDYGRFTGQSINNLSTNRLFCSKVLSGGNDVVLGFDAYLAKLSSGGKSLVNSSVVAIKSIDEIDSEYILVGMYSHAVKVNSSNLQVADTVWTGRCTKVLYSGKKYYIGTINGLYEISQDKTSKYLGDLHASLKRRITDMKATPDGTLWIATNDRGLVAYKNGKIVAEIKDSDGLSSNICKSLYLYGHYLWVGTNKGLNRIDIKNYKDAGSIVRYSSSDGLPSDIVNALYVQDSIVWVGSPAGLTYFNESKVSHTSQCKLHMHSVTVSARQMDTGSSYQLSYKDNNIKFEFVAISFKSAGDIIYRYKLSGLDTGWQQTRETTLDYPSLPPGDYQLQLYAVNKFGVKSATEEISFSIAAPFWRKWWFFAIVLLATISLTGLLVNQKNSVIRLRLEEKNSFQRQFAALEQQALQAQMNPHFIFNCLNSIQQYILTNDKEKANEYLTGFATLIRQTLDNSGKQSITVAEEIKYLSSYLEMEQMRFGDNFCYYIELSDAITPDLTRMPALLLQPYVENSLRHGIRYKQEGIGKVGIYFLMENDMLCCQVVDNGVGRKKAGEYKSSQHIEYQSKGMSLTEKRIELLNRAGNRKITVMIDDLEDDKGNAAGTRVTVRLPVE